MNPRDFRDLAVELATHSSAAHLRTAISRAYYAVFNTGCEILRKDIGMTLGKGPSAHGDIRKYLNNCGDSKVSEAASKMATLHTARIQADYRLDKKNVENIKTVAAYIKQAGEVIAVLDSCKSEPRRTNVEKAIRDYQSKLNM